LGELILKKQQTHILRANKLFPVFHLMYHLGQAAN